MGKAKIVSITNFNPVALFSLILFLIGLILGAVGTGLDRWSYLETERKYPDSQGGDLTDGGTLKVQGLFKRCIDYDIPRDLEILGLPEDQLPDDDCIDNEDLDCSNSRDILLSALDILRHDELQNSNEKDSCEDMKSGLAASAGFMILGLIATFVAILLFFPLWHWIFYVIGACVAILSVICFVVSISVFSDIPQDFSGYFSVEGEPKDGCLSYSFGLALAAFIVNVLASIVGIVAIFYRKIKILRGEKEH